MRPALKERSPQRLTIGDGVRFGIGLIFAPLVLLIVLVLMGGTIRKFYERVYGVAPPSQADSLGSQGRDKPIPTDRR